MDKKLIGKEYLGKKIDRSYFLSDYAAFVVFLENNDTCAHLLTMKDALKLLEE